MKYRHIEVNTLTFTYHYAMAKRQNSKSLILSFFTQKRCDIQQKWRFSLKFTYIAEFTNYQLWVYPTLNKISIYVYIKYMASQ